MIPFVDSLMSWVSSLGTVKDKMQAVAYMQTPMDRPQLEAAYRFDWIARKSVDIPPMDMTREWRAWQAEDDQIEEIEKAEAAFSIQLKVKQAMTRARLYGGAALVMGVEDGRDSKVELDVKKVKKGSLKFVHVVNRYEIETGDIELDVQSPFYGQPKWYKRRSPDGKEVEVHPSRVIRFLGNEIPDVLNISSNDRGWGDPILFAVDNAVRAAGVAQGGIAALIEEMKIDIIKVPGFTQTVATQAGRDNLTARFHYANTVKSLLNTLVLDEKEEWERLQLDMAGYPDLIKVYLLCASGAVDIPATRMLSQAPAGLNATGDSDTRNYYDKTGSEQKTELSPRIAPLDDVMLGHTFGTRDESIYYNWRPLWQMTEAEKAEVAYKKAQVYQIDVNAGLIPDSVMSQSRVNQLIEDAIYPGLDMEMEDFDYEGLFGDPEHPPPAADPVTGQVPPRKGQKPPPQIAHGERKKLLALPPPARRVSPPSRDSLMVERINKMVRDATPRTLYVYRQVLNPKDIIAWARKQGFKSTLEPEDMHVTIMYSKTPVDWMQIGAAYYGNNDGKLTVPPGGPRMMDIFGHSPDEAPVVLMFSSTELQWRHREMIEKGCTSDYPEYQPHITISYKGEGLDVSEIEPYQGKIELGPEIFQEIIPGANENVKEVAA